MTKKSGTPSPRVKWEILILGLMTVVIALALVVLNFCRDSLTDAPLFVAVLAAYGWMLGLMAAALGVGAIIEDFLPSYRKAKNFKDQMNYRAAVKSAVRESIRSNERKDNAIYQKFLEENPQYMV